jgi:hypothetical protein
LFPEAKGVEVDIARDLLQIGIGLDEEGLISPLIEMAGPVMGAVEMGGIGDVEVPHEFLKIGAGGLNQKMEVIGHQDIGQHLYLIDLGGAA